MAEEYERARPGYPAEAVEWLVGLEPARVVDVGAGTGKLTRQLVAMGHDVTAVEPSEQMLGQLRAAVPGARAVHAGAEAMPLGDGCADVVVAGQAFHWFDHVRALPEIARLLGPGGRLGLVWNMRDESVPWIARLSGMIDAEPHHTSELASEAIGRSGLFGPVEEATFELEQSVDRETLLDLVASRSAIAMLTAAERADVLDRVAELYEEEGAGERLALRYVTCAYRADRR